MPLAKREAAISLRTEFLLPEILTCPLRGMPPVTRYLAMWGKLYTGGKIDGCASILWKKNNNNGVGAFGAGSRSGGVFGQARG